MPTDPADVAATFCATLVDEWVRAGVTDAVVCPGSRSTPLALALAAHDRLRVHVHHDERSGGFVALGLGMASGRPAVVLTTSGTAAVELHPAVVEAHHHGIPLLACTADRPPDLQEVGAPQTIDQRHLFGPAVRWYAEPGVAEPATAGTWRSLAARAVAESTGDWPGPVHLNLAFREPLVGRAGPLPDGRPDERPWHEIEQRPAPNGAEIHLKDVCSAKRVLVVAGDGAGLPVVDEANAAGWPVIADPRSGCRIEAVTAIAHADALLRAEHFAAAHRPDVVLHLGAPPASKVLGTWLDSLDAYQVGIDRSGRWWDPGHRLALVVAADPIELLGHLAAELPRRAPAGWLEAWRAADDCAATVIAERLGDPTGGLSEPAVAWQLGRGLPDGSDLVVSSSMPVRDVEWYAPRRRRSPGGGAGGLRVLANRGANGIDGVVSTAVGVALAGRPTSLLIGDVAFLHDSNGLLGAAARDLALTVFVVDNDGGGIFEFLPQASSLPRERFEQLFGTPHGVDLAALARVHRATVAEPTTRTELSAEIAQVATRPRGVHVVIVRTHRQANVADHADLHAAIAAAVAATIAGA